MSTILSLELILDQNIFLLSLTDDCVDKIRVVKYCGETNVLALMLDFVHFHINKEQ